MKYRPVLVVLIALITLAPLRADQHNVYPLPEDRGAAGILGALESLPVYARVLYITAHPDDENAGTLAWLARKAHFRTALFSLTRGDGGQNLLGDEKYEAMGLLRTGELLEACRIYGVETYFSSVYEFGFSKTSEETFSKWGREATLEELVRFIRRFRPAIVFSAFRNDSSGGHGHHQAAGILSHEAFRAAGDPKRFPEHLQQGLLPWQPQALYSGAGRGDSARPGALAIPSGEYDPVLGRSYRQIGSEGYSKHRSQGNGASMASPARTVDSFNLVDSTMKAGEPSRGPFGSIDLTPAAIFELGGEEKQKVDFLKTDMGNLQLEAQDAIRGYRPYQPWSGSASVVRGISILKGDIRDVESAPLSGPIKARLLDALNQKLGDFERALDALLGIYITATAAEPTAVPGSKIPVTVNVYNRGGQEIELTEVKLQSPDGTIFVLQGKEAPAGVKAGDNAALRGTFQIPDSGPVTEPFWYREKPDDNRYRIRPTPDPFAPFGPPAISARVTYRFRGAESIISVPVRAAASDPLRGADMLDLQIVPAISVALKPALALVPLADKPQKRAFDVAVLNAAAAKAAGKVRLITPAGWQAEPAEASFAVSRKGESAAIRFTVNIPVSAAQGAYQVEAVASIDGRDYRQGYRVISYPENWTRNLYAPARSGVRVLDVKIDPGMTVGYVPGAGDEVPDSLEQLGLRVVTLSGDDLASGDLNRFKAIVTGIRAYNTNEGLRANNPRLLKYVEQGGVLIVQYVRPLGRGAGGGEFPYGPYPMSNSDEARITVEESPIEVLDAQHPVFNAPNRITRSDFDGWIQERGLYFMVQWDPRYTALLSGHDPGDSDRKGGMLVARYGKGYYIYSAYAWFRQLPAGVPGAYRIFANMLSLGN